MSVHFFARFEPLPGKAADLREEVLRVAAAERLLPHPVPGLRTREVGALDPGRPA